MGTLIKVELVSGRGWTFNPSPGRTFLVSTRHTFRDLALAIDLAFGRWDLSHLHAFTIPGRERRLGFAFEKEDDEDDNSRVRPVAILKRGDSFSYEFDFGDSWLHECTVEAVRVSERDVDGDGSLPLPNLPLIEFGWGSLPDQYGRSGIVTDPSDLSEEEYSEDLEDVATLMARATTVHGHGVADERAARILEAWIRLGRPPRLDELGRGARTHRTN